MRPWLTLLAVLVALSCASAPARPLPTELPHETLTTLSGENAALGIVAHGRVALVSFWATWCDSCTKELDALNRLALWTQSRDDAVVIGVAVGESRSTVDAFVRQRSVRYVQLLDANFRLVDALGQHNVPATLVLDRHGRIVYRGDAFDGESLAAFRRALED